MKDSPSETVEESSKSKVNHNVALATVTAQRAFEGIFVIVTGYVAADTVRQIVVHIAKTKIK